jgi:hypothetical protein
MGVKSETGKDVFAFLFEPVCGQVCERPAYIEDTMIYARCAEFGPSIISFLTIVGGRNPLELLRVQIQLENGSFQDVQIPKSSSIITSDCRLLSLSRASSRLRLTHSFNASEIVHAPNVTILVHVRKLPHLRRQFPPRPFLDVTSDIFERRSDPAPLFPWGFARRDLLAPVHLHSPSPSRLL